MEYRREIDGLRAIAVLAVIFFHANIPPFRGGYVGVDVFFVISGYLITTIILADVNRGTFSLVNFYERRIRRILPALFLVMLVSIPFALLWLLPDSLRSFSRSLIATSLFASNIYFWQSSDYFDAETELKPFLHTWSLSLEEQYYILFPLLILACWKFRRQLILPLLSLLCIASLGVSQWAVHHYSAAAFYLLPTRAWELIIGALVSFYFFQRRSQPSNKTSQEIGSWLGILLISYAIFQYDSTTPFPGFHALAPTIGTALIIIFTRPQTTVGYLLASKPLVGIGLISYSAYLWHQPLFAFARLRSLPEPSQTEYTVLIVSTFVLAYLSWKYVETPFRKKNLLSTKKIFAFAALGSTVFFTFGLIGQLTNGTYFRSSASLHSSLPQRFLPDRGLSVPCGQGQIDSPTCRHGNEPEIAVWGDSYAMHLVNGLLASDETVTLVQFTQSACGPTLGIAPLGVKRNHLWPRQCIEFNDEVLNRLKTLPSVEYVVLASAFHQYILNNATVMTYDGRVLQGRTAALASMQNTIRSIKELGKTPVVFSPPPGNGKNIGNCLRKALLFGKPMSLCDFASQESMDYQVEIRNFLHEIEEDARVIWLSDYLCDHKICRASMGGVPLYRDNGHFTREGSIYLGRHVHFYKLLKSVALNHPANPSRR